MRVASAQGPRMWWKGMSPPSLMGMKALNGIGALLNAGHVLVQICTGILCGSGDALDQLFAIGLVDLFKIHCVGSE